MSKTEKDRALEDLLAYRSLNRLSQVKTIHIRHVWLIHGDISTQDKSSYDNTGKLEKSFSSENMRIHPRHINDVNDLEEIFKVINSIVEHISDYNIERDDIICDYTARTKAISIGMTFACLGNLRLAFFPQDGTDNYLEIDTNHLLYSVFVQRRFLRFDHF